MDKWYKDIPNYLTVGNLLCGLIGIERVFEGDVLTAFYLVLVAAVLDFADGWTARKLGVDGEMGKQLDSLADLVTFGVLPGLILHHYLMFYGYCNPNGFCSSRYAWIAIPVGAAWRLARFNISKEHGDGFTGVPTPITGISFASLSIALTPGDWVGFVVLNDVYKNFYFLTMAPVFAAFLMVSDLPMLAFKPTKSGKNPWPVRIALIVLWIAAIVLFGRDSGPVILLIYVLTSILANFAILSKSNG